MALERITQTNIKEALRRKVEQIQQKPEYMWADGRRNHKVNDDGRAAVKTAVANCTLDFDLWKGLRNPALIGRYPIGLRQIWEYYATNDVKKTQPDECAPEGVRRSGQMLGQYRVENCAPPRDAQFRKLIFDTGVCDARLWDTTDGRVEFHWSGGPCPNSRMGPHDFPRGN